MTNTAYCTLSEGVGLVTLGTLRISKAQVDRLSKHGNSNNYRTQRVTRSFVHQPQAISPKSNQYPNRTTRADLKLVNQHLQSCTLAVPFPHSLTHSLTHARTSTTLPKNATPPRSIQAHMSIHFHVRSLIYHQPNRKISEPFLPTHPRTPAREQGCSPKKSNPAPNPPCVKSSPDHRSNPTNRETRTRPLGAASQLRVMAQTSRATSNLISALQPRLAWA